MQQIQAIKFDVEEVGKHVKGSKKRFTWDIALKDKPHTIVLDFSFISGKVKITVDRKILLQNELPANVSFQYPFTLDGFALNIIQQGESFELRVNNKVFSHLYTQQKTNTEFRKYEEEVKDIKVSFAEFNPPNKKISLNIGALGPHKKKKEATGESAGWNAFTGGSFPSYFGDTPQLPELKQPPPPKFDLLSQQQKTETSSVQTRFPDSISESKKQQSFFDFNSQPQKPSNSQQFGNVQQMFSGLNLKAQPTNQVDFFADQPKKQPTPTPLISSQPQNNNLGSFSFNQFSGNAFSTGVRFDPLQVNPKQFSTTVGSKPAELNFFNQGQAKQEINLNLGFTKKSSVQVSPTQQSNLLSSQGLNVQNTETKANSGLTDISLNDFMVHKKAQTPANIDHNLDFSINNLQNPSFNLNQNTYQPNPQASDFSTMQLLFQTNSTGQNNFGGLNQLNSLNLTQPQPNLVNNTPLSPQTTNDAQFNTMRNFFQTTNYENLAVNRPQNNEPKVLPDFLKNNKPETFATMGGVGATGFNMAAFGTMQLNNPQKPTLDYNFFQKKPSNPSPSTSGNLI